MLGDWQALGFLTIVVPQIALIGAFDCIRSELVGFAVCCMLLEISPLLRVRMNSVWVHKTTQFTVVEDCH